MKMVYISFISPGVAITDEYIRVCFLSWFMYDQETWIKYHQKGMKMQNMNIRVSKAVDMGNYNCLPLQVALQATGD